MTQKYGKAIIIFDGYTCDPTTKDATHLWQTGACCGVTVFFTGDMILQSKKEASLNNKVNKQCFIHHLSIKLEHAGCQTEHARHDADVLIVQTVIASAKLQYTVLIADDTDLLVLLLYHADMSAHEVFMAPEPKQSSKSDHVWCIKQFEELLGMDICQNVLFLHAVLGCNTTSRLFGIGKGLAVKKFMNDPIFIKQAEQFNQTDQTPESIVTASEKAIVSLYGGSKTDGLDSLHYKCFCDKVSKSTMPVEPHSLPPTSAAVKYHSLRMYYQVMEWKDASNNMKPEDWGWHIVDGKYKARQTSEPPAPSQLLDIICCGCKKDCNTRRCTC